MRHAELPAVPGVDDRAVEPETGTEMIDGELRKVLPAYPPHADEQCNIAYVIRPDVAPGYTASTELLTRVDEDNDFATDACIRKLGHDPATGARYLEEISFEVKHTQSDADLLERAMKLIRRGVRRVFAIHVREDDNGVIHAGPVKEWLAGENRWVELAPDAEIEDRCLVQPIRVRALLDAAEADDQVARVLLAKNNRVFAAEQRKALKAQEKELTEAHQRELEAQKKASAQARARELEAQEKELTEAHRRELEVRDKELAQAQARELEARARELEARTRELALARQVILELCDVLAIEVTDERRARMEAMTGDELDALRAAIRERHGWPEEL